MSRRSTFLLSHAYEELFGEKVRALAERTRPRDLHRSYRVDRIQGARITNRTFEPRYFVELSPQRSSRRSAIGESSEILSAASTATQATTKIVMGEKEFEGG
jgi:predicted nucleotidyltransferase component of viral defense system